jgi:hypothetical protein
MTSKSITEASSIFLPSERISEESRCANKLSAILVEASVACGKSSFLTGPSEIFSPSTQFKLSSASEVNQAEIRKVFYFYFLPQFK